MFEHLFQWHYVPRELFNLTLNWINLKWNTLCKPNNSFNFWSFCRWFAKWAVYYGVFFRFHSLSLSMYNIFSPEGDGVFLPLSLCCIRNSCLTSEWDVFIRQKHGGKVFPFHFAVFHIAILMLIQSNSRAPSHLPLSLSLSLFAIMSLYSFRFTYLSWCSYLR